MFGAPPQARPEWPEARSLARLRILLVEDEPGTRAVVAEALEHAEAHVTAVGALARARTVLAETAFDVLVADRMLSDGDGLSGLLLAPHARRLARVGISAFYDAAMGIAVQEAGGIMLAKPFDPDTLVRAVLEACNRARIVAHRPLLRFGPFEFDSHDGTLRGPFDGSGTHPVTLPTGERKVLACLFAHVNERVPPKQVAAEALGRRDAAGPHLVSEYVSRLRQRLPERWRHLIRVGKGEAYRVIDVSTPELGRGGVRIDE